MIVTSVFRASSAGGGRSKKLVIENAKMKRIV